MSKRTNNPHSLLALLILAPLTLLSGLWAFRQRPTTPVRRMQRGRQVIHVEFSEGDDLGELIKKAQS